MSKLKKGVRAKRGVKLRNVSKKTRFIDKVNKARKARRTRVA